MTDDKHDWRPIAWWDTVTNSVRTETYHRYTLLKALCSELNVQWPPKKEKKVKMPNQNDTCASAAGPSDL